MATKMDLYNASSEFSSQHRAKPSDVRPFDSLFRAPPPSPPPSVEVSQPPTEFSSSSTRYNSIDSNEKHLSPFSPSLLNQKTEQIQSFEASTESEERCWGPPGTNRSFGYLAPLIYQLRLIYTGLPEDHATLFIPIIAHIDIAVSKIGELPGGIQIVIDEEEDRIFTGPRLCKPEQVILPMMVVRNHIQIFGPLGIEVQKEFAKRLFHSIEKTVMLYHGLKQFPVRNIDVDLILAPDSVEMPSRLEMERQKMLQLQRIQNSVSSLGIVEKMSDIPGAKVYQAFIMEELDITGRAEDILTTEGVILHMKRTWAAERSRICDDIDLIWQNEKGLLADFSGVLLRNDGVSKAQRSKGIKDVNGGIDGDFKRCFIGIRYHRRPTFTIRDHDKISMMLMGYYSESMRIKINETKEKIQLQLQEERKKTYQADKRKRLRDVEKIRSRSAFSGERDHHTHSNDRVYKRLKIKP